MATNTTIQAINNAVPNVGMDTPHPEEPTRKLLNAILRDYLQALESLENDTVTKSQIVQDFGYSQTAVISQAALTDYLSNLSFLQLADTPYVYAGSIGKFIRVNAAGDGLEFFELDAALKSTSINTDAGLSGGGDLSANRTISIADSHIPIGVGQTWQDVTEERSVGTTYTNTTGRPIVVVVDTTMDGELEVDNISMGDMAHYGTMGIVPNGSTYRLSGGVLQAWSELR